MEKERLVKAAEAYTGRGWKVFTVGPSKRPWHNCRDCGAGAHDGEMCECLFCHGHQAASGDLERVRAMIWGRDEVQLAIRCGQASGGLVVLDGESHDAVEHGRTGVEVLDMFDAYVPGASLPDTLRARTGSGGLHLFYTVGMIGEGGCGVPSRNRVLPSVDVKADGGYVVVPPAAGRNWLNWGTDVTLIPPESELRTWLGKVRGGSGGGGAGGSKGRAAVLVDGMVPAGSRFEFTRGLVYKLRKQGVEWDDALEICRSWWTRYEQPPDGVRLAGGVWYLPWSQVEYELGRVWARVEPRPPLDQRLQAWMEKNR